MILFPTTLPFEMADRLQDNKWVARIYASITAGACSTLATNPIWVIKTRLMSQVSRSASDGARTPWHYNNTWDAARKMLANEGIASFYSGLSPALLGLTHVAIQFPLYEYFKMKFTGLEMGLTCCGSMGILKDEAPVGDIPLLCSFSCYRFFART